MFATGKNQKKLYALFFILLIVTGFLFLNFQFTHAQAGHWQIMGTQAIEDQAKAARVTNLKEGSGIVGQGVSWATSKLLQAVLIFMGDLVTIAATLFEWIIVPDNMKAVIDNTAIYTIWTLVRDTLNIAFIMMLLFSAFCTVFQVSKYNYKSILLSLILMALLVNFSFPIARVIIDFSNILMYYFLNQLGGPGSFASIADTGKLSGILNPDDPSISFLIAAIIFSFIFAVTLLAIAVLLIIRSSALAILVIFSPIAFVGSIVPALSSHASKWWTQLFNYCFFGPIMIFMIYVATQMMNVLSHNSKFNSSLEAAAGKQATSDLSGFIVTASFFTIPIIILWIGIGMAQSMSITGAGAVMGKANQFMKWAGRGTYKAPWWLIGKKTGLEGGYKQKWENWKKTGRLFGSDVVARRAAEIAGGGIFKVKGALESDMRKKAEEYKSKNIEELEKLASNGNAAATLRLADDRNLKQDVYNNFIKANENTLLHKAINNKLKQTRADIVANYAAQEKIDKMTPADIGAARETAKKARYAGTDTWDDDDVKRYAKKKSVEQDIGKLNSEKFAEQNWIEIANQPDKQSRKFAIRAAVKWFEDKDNRDPAINDVRRRMAPVHIKALKKVARDLGYGELPI